MLFNSIDFLLFFPIVACGFYVIPKKLRQFWLLLASYYFYMCWNAKYAVLIATSTVVTYSSGLLLEKLKDRKQLKNLVLALCLVCNFGILFFFKYFEWFLDNLNAVCGTSVSLPFDILLPVGISFYTFQAVGYTIDVYRHTIDAEHSFARYALFVSFFPQLVAGPIERSSNLLKQIHHIDLVKADGKNIRKGLCMMLWGFFLKLVIADRAAIFVDQVFNHYQNYGFVELAVAAILFAVQILCDFNGYTTIAIGCAEVMGVQLMNNFRQPYLACSIKDFWRRWHISLTSWFTDYLYIPLGGNRKGFVRTLIHTLVVFLTSGLWHGASWHYVIWGGAHGVFQCVGNLKRHIGVGEKQTGEQSKGFGNRFLHILITFVLVDVAWVFFRASSVRDSIAFFRQMLTGVQKVSLLRITFSWYEWLILLLAILMMFAVDLLHENRIRVREILFRQNLVFRWIVYLAAFWVIILFGVYGAEYDQSQFIYFQF